MFGAQNFVAVMGGQVALVDVVETAGACGSTLASSAMLQVDGARSMGVKPGAVGPDIWPPMDRELMAEMVELAETP